MKMARALDLIIWFTVVIFSAQDAEESSQNQKPAYIGDNVTLDCLSAISGGKFKWQKLSPKVENLNSTGSTYTIQSVTASDSGTYKCETDKSVSHYISHAGRTVTLTVQERKARLELITSHIDGSIFERDQINMTCYVDGDPVGWTYELHMSERVMSYKSQMERTFTFNCMTLSQAGNYNCRARKGDLYSNFSNLIHIHVSALNVTLTAFPKSPMKEGDSLQLVCTWMGNGRSSSNLTYSFLRNNVTVKKSSSSSVFSIKEIEKNHTGNYTCAVESPGRGKAYSDDIEIEVQALTVTLTVAPGGSVMEGDCLTLNCTWRVNGSSSSKLNFSFWRDCVSVKNDSDFPVFSIQEINKSHSGNYTCAVELPGGGQKYSNTVNVQIQALQVTGIPGGAGLCLLLLILPLLLLLCAYHRIQDLLCALWRRRRTDEGRAVGNVITEASDGSQAALQTETFNMADETKDVPEVIYSVLGDFPKSKKIGKPLVHSSLIYSEVRVPQGLSPPR
ncbi:carcinoembryonic antigen-related cell adhesion molecule 5-like isoform X2 [Erpetoichthys calabaricus]|uniref:carcinoembryonic antigen-related cell adhesion molecule 5-like isoform X2 n=1 Tax=Erpetoichthys calabaricus TaxID=27687 RepID=UPI0022345F7D|nr:carcinoembryonic antigen-related cell adhesion molecule 5-like isoform X2 [Erpetoichthys calabaricus]